MIEGNKTTHNTNHHKHMNTKQWWEQNLEGVKEQLVHLKTTQKRTMANSNGNCAQQKQMRELLHTQVAPSLTLICLHGYYTALIFYIRSCKYICIFFTLLVCKCKCIKNQRISVNDLHFKMDYTCCIYGHWHSHAQH
jgi:hypothetical protein